MDKSKEPEENVFTSKILKVQSLLAKKFHNKTIIEVKALASIYQIPKTKTKKFIDKRVKAKPIKETIKNLI